MTIEEARLEYLAEGWRAIHSGRVCRNVHGACICLWWSLQADAASMTYDLVVAEWAARKGGSGDQQARVRRPRTTRAPCPAAGAYPAGGRADDTRRSASQR